MSNDPWNIIELSRTNEILIVPFFACENTDNLTDFLSDM